MIRFSILVKVFRGALNQVASVERYEFQGDSLGEAFVQLDMLLGSAGHFNWEYVSHEERTLTLDERLDAIEAKTVDE